MKEFKQYKRIGVTEMRPYEPGEDLTGVSVSPADQELKIKNRKEFNRGMIARNPKNHGDKWYVARIWFDDNYELSAQDKETTS